MEIGVALPQMALGYGGTTTVDWARGIDEGPFSSVSAGERVTFSNPEMVASLAAAAAVTKRVRVFANLWVLPVHPMAMVAQQVGTLDQLSGGRLSIAVGVGGRDEDYRALGSPFAGRHARLDDQVAELRRLLAGEPAVEGGQPVGPALGSGPLEVLAGALGPKAMNRAARWADGVSGFSLAGRYDEIASTNALADRAWEQAGRTTPPRKVSGCFYALGVEDPLATLHAFAARYLAFTGPHLAEALATQTRTASAADLREVLDGAEAAGCDEFILVPATTDLRCLAETADLVAARR